MSSFISKTVPTTNEVLLDMYRYLHPTERGSYTCWCTVTGSRQVNYGQRIDYILASRGLADHIVSCDVLQKEMGSDHCPVVAQLSVSIVPSPVLSQHCSSFYPRFAGRQSKLSSFFSKGPVKRSDSETLNAETSCKKLCSEEKEEKKKTASLVESASDNNSSKKLSSDWQKVFKAPPKAPLCSGHKEPSVLRVVKKPGPNQNRKFYVCARPDGSKHDPNARCNYFKWLK